MVVSGFVTVLIFDPHVSVDLRAGVGVVIEEGEGYALESREGAVVIEANAERLNVSKEAISTPERIIGQSWLGEGPAVPSNVRHIFK